MGGSQLLQFRVFGLASGWECPGRSLPKPDACWGLSTNIRRDPARKNAVRGKAAAADETSCSKGQ
jgi:hypothetical protein